jgi:hypothetical protein
VSLSSSPRSSTVPPQDNALSGRRLPLPRKSPRIGAGGSRLKGAMRQTGRWRARAEA